MTEISHPKLDTLGGYASFCGFSLLFDNPGTNTLCLLENSVGESLGKINCHVQNTPELELYAGFRDGLARIGLMELSAEYGFSPLNPASYHVTVWDGLNEDNKQKISDRYWAKLDEFFRSLPDHLSKSCFTQHPPLPLLNRASWEITFQCKELGVFTGSSALVAVLEPADPVSEAILADIKQARIERYEQFDEKFGLYETRYPYGPHVSLGYFWNKDKAQEAKNRLKDQGWKQIFKKCTNDLLIQFSSISLYGFLDMETFFKCL